ncbi:hypothetical protein [Agathobaculum sp.]|nr:hypothetical protein [Agathobaculum sp.]MDY3619450.1 hypothetical protein [Agathobaculum sp.]
MPAYTTDPAQIKSYLAETNDAFTDKWLAEYPNFLEDNFKSEASRA